MGETPDTRVKPQTTKGAADDTESSFRSTVKSTEYAEVINELVFMFIAEMDAEITLYDKERKMNRQQTIVMQQ